MQGVQIIRDYNAQAPKKTKNIALQIGIVVGVGLLLVLIYIFVVTPIRRSSLEKQIANLQADLAL